MKHVNQVWIPLLDEAIRVSINLFSSKNEGNALADLYIYPDEEDRLRFFDDMENEIHTIQLDKESANNASKFEKQLSQTFQHVLQKLQEENFFDRNFIFKPFTVSLVDKDFIVTEELIFVDDDTVKLDGDLLSGLDDELDSFFRDLMKK